MFETQNIVLFLPKLLPVFMFPLGFALLLGFAALLFARARRAAQRFLVLALAILFLASAPAFANWLTGMLEGEYPPKPIAEMPSADIAILLGGILGQPVPPRTEPDLGDPVDRVIEAWRLYRAGKAKAILVSGGNLPWESATEPESVLLKKFLVELGVPERDVVVETESRNTHENAVNSALLLKERGWNSALLVTSGTHMKRAMGAFRQAGVNVIAAPTDTRAHGPLAQTLLDFLPDAEALASTTSVCREWLGLLYYRLRSWA